MKMSDTNLGSAKATAQAINSAHEDDLAKGQSPEDLEAKSLAQTHPHSQPMNVQVQGEDLIKVLQRQLEYYFSRTNLAKDTYLLSQMDSQQYVAIKTIANFNAIKKLTSDINLVVIALRGSPVVQVDESGEKVRPKKRRCIIILREIPDNVDGSQVMSLFDGGPAKYSSCEFAGNGNWYILFETEDDAHKAYWHLRETVKEFMGKPIMARIKLKTHHLNTYGYPLPQRTPQSQDTLKANLSTPATGGYVTPQPQVTSTPMEYFQPQRILFCPQPPFSTTAHPGVSLPSTPFLTHMAIPNAATVASNGAASHLAAANTSLSGFVVAPWQGAGLYPPQAPQDPSTIRAPQVTQQSLQPLHDSIHSSQHHRGYADINKPSNPATNRNVQNQHQAPPGPQLQLPHSSMTQPRYILSTDRVHPNFDVLPHYVQSDPITAARLIPPMSGYSIPHFVSAINPRGPPVAPPNDPTYVAALPQGYMHNHNPTRPVQTMRRGNNPRTSHQTDHQRGSNTFPGDRQPRRSDAHRPSNHSYQSEISPRFLQKGGVREHQFPATHPSSSSTSSAHKPHRYNDHTSRPTRGVTAASSADNVTATRPLSSDTSFDLQSNSFPPLPVAPEQLQGRVTGNDGADVSGATQAAQKLSDMSIASLKVIPTTTAASTHQPQQNSAPMSATTCVRPSDVESGSNAKLDVQPLSGSISTNPANRPPQAAESIKAENQHEQVAKQFNASRQILTPANHATTSVTTNKSLTTSASKPIDSRQPSSAPAQTTVVPSSDIIDSEKTTVEAFITRKVDKTENTEETDEQGDKMVSNESKPTYAEMLKLKNAVAEMNGKVSSDANRSDTEDFEKSNDDCRESDAKDSVETKSDPKLAAKRTEDLGNKAENPTAMANGKPRHSDFEHRRGSWHNRKHTDRNDGFNRFRGNRSGGWGYAGEKRHGPQEYRGRGRGVPRGSHRFHRERQHFGKGTNERNGPFANEQVPLER